MPNQQTIIPENWKKISLEKECWFERGMETGADAYNTEGIGERFIRVVDVTESRENSIFVDGILTTKRVKKDDILLTLDGTIGAVRIGLEGIYSTGVRKVLFREKKNSNHLLYYLLQGENVQRTIDLYSSGSTIKHASSAIPHLFVSIPETFAEQEKIADVLNILDRTIEETTALIKKYEHIRAGMMQDLFRYGVDKDGNIRTKKTHKFKDTPLGLVPADWEIKNLGSMRQFITSGSRGWAQYYSEEGALFLRIGNLSRENINLKFDDTVYVNPPKNSEGNRTKTKAGDVLVSITADLGITALVPDGLGDAYVNQHIALLRFTDTQTLSPWVAYYLWSGEGQKQFQVLNDGGAKAGLNLPTVDNILIPLPTKEERQKIVQSMTSIDESIESEYQLKRKLEKLKKGLAEDLLTGKVRTNNLIKK